MSTLSDVSIDELCTQKDPLISPYNWPQLQPASYDLTLHEIGADKRDVFLLPSRKFILASTLETVHLPANVQGVVMGKSSLARQGLQIESAGFVDPGFFGQLVLEVYNFSSEAIQLGQGMLIAQIVFNWLDQPARAPYGTDHLNSHYQYQVGVTESRT